MIRVEPTIKRAAEIAARDDCRSLASLVQKLLLEHLRQQGYLTTRRGTGGTQQIRDASNHGNEPVPHRQSDRS